MKKYIKLIPCYAIVVGLAIFYIVTLINALNPRVDKVYRAFYIDKTIDKVYTSKDNKYGVEYQFGTPIINNGDANNQLKYLAKGWSGVEAGCVWQIGKESEILVYLNEINKEEYNLKLNIATTTGENTIGVYINNKEVSSYEIAEGYTGEVVVNIDSSLLEENEYNFITLKAENYYIPSEINGSADNRALVCLLYDMVLE